MFILSNFLIALARIMDVILTMMYWMILIRVLLSWVNPDPYNFIVQLLYKITEPVLRPLRNILPMMPIDISPIIAFLAIIFIRSFIVKTLFDLANRL